MKLNPRLHGITISPHVAEKIKRLMVRLCEQDIPSDERFDRLQQALATGIDRALSRYEPKPLTAQEIAKMHLKHPQVGDRWIHVGSNKLYFIIYHVTNEHDFIAWVWDDSPRFVRMDREYLAWQVHVCPSKTQDGPVDFDTLPISHFSHLCRALDAAYYPEEVLKIVSDNAQSNVAEDLRINKSC